MGHFFTLEKGCAKGTGVVGRFREGIEETGVGVEEEPIITVKDCVVDAVGGRGSNSRAHRSGNLCERHDASEERGK